MRRRAWGCMAGALLTLALPSCRVGDLAFRQDHRIEIVSPEQRSTVTLPFELHWTVNDFRAVGSDGSASDDRGSFAVLLDRSPMPPGEDVSYFARDDDSCIRLPGCPDATYLADRDVYLTTATTFRVETLRDTRPVDRRSAPDDHEITIVLLNGQSERIGESAFKLEITVDREQE